MEVWPPPPTSNADPPPGDTPPRRRLVTRFVWKDVLLGIAVAANSFPDLAFICIKILQAASATRPSQLEYAICFIGSWVLNVLVYAILCRMRFAFAFGALTVTVLLWLPVLLFVLRKYHLLS